MFPVTIDAGLTSAAPNLALGVVSASMLDVTAHDETLWTEIDQRILQIRKEETLEGLPQIPQIRALREAYRVLGKDPSRYRGSQEALLRRILQGKGLYRINTVVDINNLVSLETRHSVGSYNVARLQGPVVFRRGKEGESYKGIGKETINIGGLPVFADATGPFGSPTSDSERAMITLETRAVLMVVISFAGASLLVEQVDRARGLLMRYANAQTQHIETAIVR